MVDDNTGEREAYLAYLNGQDNVDMFGNQLGNGESDDEFVFTDQYLGQLSDDEFDPATFVDQYLGPAEVSGLDTDFMKQITDGFSKLGTFAKNNKEILGMFGSGISNAKKEKSASERQDKQNQYLAAAAEQKRKWEQESAAQKRKWEQESAAQKRAWDLEDALRKKADEKETYDRYNKSIVDTPILRAPIINGNIFANQIAALRATS